MAADVLDDSEIALGPDDFDSQELYDHYCLLHSTAHLMAAAIQTMRPEAKFAIGPPTKDGTNRFYYDMELEEPLSEDDLETIEATMKKLAKKNDKFEQSMWPKDQALEYFAEHGQDYKVELIENLNVGEVSVYKTGEFVDLCSGPHVRYSKKIKHFKLLSLAGAYWRGDSDKTMLTRVYGTVWPTKDALEGYLHRLEEAKKRDHRRLGKQLELFMTHEWAPGSAFWLPKGQLLYHTLSQRMRDLLIGEGYLEVGTPQLFNKKLWETSGHWQHYQENMYSFQDGDSEDGKEAQTFSLKPMNCPSHMLIFGSKRRSYRELPVRFFDQGVLHRNEITGALSGLTRVRMFRQDDAHIFVAPEDVAAEVGRVMGLLDRVYRALDLGYRVVLSTRPAKAMGDPEMWDKAEAELENTLKESGVEYVVEHGEGAFYGPKIDFKVRDSLDREHQCATIQLDGQLPKSFGLKYTTAENSEAQPLVIHRAIYGSFERFIAILIEHFAGAFPLWLSPEQVRVLTISEKFLDYGREVTEAFEAAGLRVHFDDSDEKVGAKVRLAELDRVPFMITVGANEQETRTVNIRERGAGRKSREMELDAFVAWLSEKAEFSF